MMPYAMVFDHRRVRVPVYPTGGALFGKRKNTTRPMRIGVLAAVSTSALFLAACGSTPKLASPTATRNQSALASWKRDYISFDEIAHQYPVNPANPVLPRIFVQPALGEVKASFGELHIAGGVGPRNYGADPLKVINSSPAKVVVAGCVWDSGAYYESNGKPLMNAFTHKRSSLSNPGSTVVSTSMVPDRAHPGNWLIAQVSNQAPTGASISVKGTPCQSSAG